MFGNRNGDTMAKTTGASMPNQINMIGEGTVFEGTLRAQSDVRVSGRIDGQLHVQGKVIIAQEGVVEGELTATSADIAGTVQGEVTVEERLVLKGSARIEGNVRAARLVIEEGAVFDGACTMGALGEVRDVPAGTPAKGDGKAASGTAGAGKAGQAKAGRGDAAKA